ncbi:MAG: FKBP-type peptidyl-prolyl cis-trans isomerase [Propionibacteriaceae bacterium]|nr:FKBP-type peptidyl-prolyl cis-trans isomerase [Propionibacteriaceae bacterium]
MTRITARRITGCIVALGLVLTMGACSVVKPSEDPTPEVDPRAFNPPPDSPELDAIVVEGGYGEAPTVTVPAPWTTNTTYSRNLVQGTGTAARDIGFVKVHYTGVNARTGKVFDSSWDRGKPTSFSLLQVVPGFQKGLAGQQVGTRVLLAITGADGYDSSGGNEDAGIEYGDSLIFVIDILQVDEDVEVTDTALPTVTGPFDEPVVTIPTGAAPPSELVVQPLLTGAGDEITAQDYLMVDYAEYMWSSGKLVRQTYGFQPKADFLANGLDGWGEGLVGVTTGSRVLLVVPPDLAYPDGNPDQDIPKGATMVYVIDILASVTYA